MANEDDAPNAEPFTPSPYEAGNIDLSHRPRVQNPDGSVSTVRSISVEMDGRVYLIPTVVGDKVVSNEEAIAHFRATHEHLGSFPDEQTAEAEAQRIHDTQADSLRDTPNAGAPLAQQQAVPVARGQEPLSDRPQRVVRSAVASVVDAALDDDPTRVLVGLPGRGYQEAEYDGGTTLGIGTVVRVDFHPEAGTWRIASKVS